MKLYGTKPSHFTRKNRVVFHELELDYEFVELSELLEVGKEKFAGNPLHMFPVLETKDNWLVESDRISEFLIEKFGSGTPLSQFMPEDRFSKIELWNFQSIINGVMESAVHRIRAQRSGITNIDQYPFFRQEREALISGLDWLNSNLDGVTSFSFSGFCYLDISLLCLLEWAIFREQIEDLAEYKNLMAFQAQHQDRASLRSTHPAL